MAQHWLTNPSVRWRALWVFPLLACLAAALIPAPVRAVDIVNRATVQLSLPSLREPLTLTTDPVTTRVQTPEGLPFQITKQASQTSVAPGQELLFTLTATRLSNTVAHPVAVTVNGLPQSLLLVKDMIPANTSLVRVGDHSPGLPLYHLIGEPEHHYYTTPPAELIRVDKLARGFPQLPVGTNVTVTFVVAVSPRADGPLRNTAMICYAETPEGPPRQINSNTVQFDVAGPPPAIRTFRDNGFSTPITSILLNQPIFVEAQSAACNAVPDVIETNIVVITSARTGDRESMIVVETGPNTGLFRVQRGAPTRDAGQFPVEVENGWIETTRDDSLTAEFLGCGTRRVVTLILIDPSGVVFDSRSNTPIEGARVTLLDATTGSPAQVFGTDGLSPAPNPVVTAADGRYVFPTVRPGTYRLYVQPPPGYSGPTTQPAAALPAGRTIHSPGSFGGNFPVSAATGAVTIDYPLDPLAVGGVGMFLQKTGSRATAEIGDFVDYAVKLRNVSGRALTGVRIFDGLPLGFAYQSGSARFEGAAIQPVSQGGGPRLEFLVGAVAKDATVTLTYRVRIGPGALQGNGINSASAVSSGPPVFTSNVASFRVQLQGGVFTDKAFIIGKVFVDTNGNRIQDPGEPGIPGVRIFIEDGSYAVTDGAGKYSFYGLRPRTHVVKLDETTLPAGSKMLVLSTRNAGAGTSRFADLKRGELHKADFAEGSATPEILAEVQARRKKAGALNGELDAQLKSELTRDGLPVPVGDPRAQPASGLIGPARNAPGANADPGRLTRPAATSTNQFDSATTNAPTASFADPSAATTNAVGQPSPPAAAGTGMTTNELFSPLLPTGPLAAEVSGLPASPAAPAPLLNLAAAVTNLDNTLGFIDFKDRDTLPLPQATVRVKGVQGAKFTLTVNGAEIPASRIGRRTELAEKKLQVWEYIGVNFQPGENLLELVQKDPFGNVRGTRKLTLIAPDRLGRIRILLPKDLPAADGRTPVTVGVELVDAKGVPVTARTALTLESSLGRWQVEDLDRKEPGIQVFLEGGRGEYTLTPPMEPGDAQIVVSSGILKGEATLAFLPELRPMLAVGVIEGQLNLQNFSTRDLIPTRSRDGFDEELRGFAFGGADGKLFGGGRAAFYLKGKIKGDALLTASYDSDKATRERLFRDIQPDEFYPVYGDSSVRGFDAQSTGKFFVRVNKRKCYALYGDYITQSSNEARSLGNYNRSLTGVKTHLEQKWLSVNAWAAHDSTRQIIEELPANGTSGPYQFRTSDGLVNSEKVEILTRDRQQPSLILKIVPLSRFSDYEFEPFTGRILFRAPVPSLDANLNPISIRVTYEVDQGGDKFWVYGADGQVKLHERIEVGVSGARDQNPVAPYQLYGANSTLKLGQKTFLLGEVAWSEAGDINGSAGRVELRHQDDKNEVRVYWGRADNTFSNSAAILSAGRVESGVKLVRKLGASTRLLGQAIDTSAVGAGTRRGAVLGVEHTFKNQLRAEFGGRYSIETGGTAGPVLAFPGLTPNEVASLRAKLTAPIPRIKGGSVYSEFENDIRRINRRMAALGADYQVNTQTKVYARHEFLSSVGSPFDLNAVQQQNTTVFGVDTAYMKDGKLFNEYRMRNAITGREAEAATGLRNGWNIADGLRLNTTLERVSPLVRGGQSEATAGTAGLEYTGSSDWKASTRIELRTSRPNDSLLHTFAYARRLNDDWTFLGRTILHVLHNNGAPGGEKFQGRIQGGFAWRQSEPNVWNALMKVEYKREDDSTQPALPMGRDVAILSVHAHYQPKAHWFASAHYAGKAVWENSLGRNSAYLAHLFAGRTSYEITKRIDLGLNVSALVSGNLQSAQFGFGPELGYVLKNNIRFGLGYNLFGFRDRDLGAEDYTSQGAYLALRMKFDEGLLHRLNPTGKKPAE